MTKVGQNVVFLMAPSHDGYETSLKSGRMYFNRFFIDEDAGFESSGVYFLNTPTLMEELRFLLEISYPTYQTMHGDILDEKTTSHAKKFDTVFREVSKLKSRVWKTHFVVAGKDYFDIEDRLRFLMLNGMEKYKINSVLVTNIQMMRDHLVTKEKMKDHCLGKKAIKMSINEDLETFFEDLQHDRDVDTVRQGHSWYTNCVQTYFIPKLTTKEKELAEKADLQYFQNFTRGLDAFVNEYELKRSESSSLFERSRCLRKTFKIKSDQERFQRLSSSPTETENNNSSYKPAPPPRKSASDLSLGFLLYGASAYKNQDFVKSQVNHLVAFFMTDPVIHSVGTGEIYNRLGKNQTPAEKRTKRTNKGTISKAVMG